MLPWSVNISSGIPILENILMIAEATDCLSTFLLGMASGYRLKYRKNILETKLCPWIRTYNVKSHTSK